MSVSFDTRKSAIYASSREELQQKALEKYNDLQRQKRIEAFYMDDEVARAEARGSLGLSKMKKDLYSREKSFISNPNNSNVEQILKQYLPYLPAQVINKMVRKHSSNIMRDFSDLLPMIAPAINLEFKEEFKKKSPKDVLKLYDKFINSIPELLQSSIQYHEEDRKHFIPLQNYKSDFAKRLESKRGELRPLALAESMREIKKSELNEIRDIIENLNQIPVQDKKISREEKNESFESKLKRAYALNVLNADVPERELYGQERLLRIIDDNKRRENEENLMTRTLHDIKNKEKFVFALKQSVADKRSSDEKYPVEELEAPAHIDVEIPEHREIRSLTAENIADLEAKKPKTNNTRDVNKYYVEKFGAKWNQLTKNQQNKLIWESEISDAKVKGLSIEDVIAKEENKLISRYGAKKKPKSTKLSYLRGYAKNITKILGDPTVILGEQDIEDLEDLEDLEDISEEEIPEGEKVMVASGLRKYVKKTKKGRPKKRIIQGRGLKKYNVRRAMFESFGIYLINLTRLHEQCVFNLVYKTKKTIPNLPSVKISENFREVIYRILANEHIKNVKLTDTEKEYLQKIIKRSGVLDSSVNEQNKLENKFNILLGEVGAGNNNEDIKEQINKLKKQLKKIN